MDILVTGASGFLGQVVTEYFRAGHRVTALGHRNAGGDVWPVDLRDVVAFRAVLEEARPDVVVHCAAYRDPDFCETEQEETRRLNVTPLRTLVDTLPPSTKLIFISTDYVFDGEHPPYREDDERNPVNFYGQSKKEAEDIVFERSNAVALRVPLLMGYGKTFKTSGFIAKTADLIRAGQPAGVEHRTMRFPTDIRDVAAAIDFLLERDARGAFHVSGPVGKTNYQWALELAAIMGRSAEHLKPIKDPAARKAIRPANSQLAIDRIRSLGFTRQTPFAEVARRVLALQ